MAESSTAMQVTPPGLGGIQIFALRGSVGAFLRAHAQPGEPPRALWLARLIDGAETVDEGIVHRLGPDRADIAIHGGDAVASRLVRLLVDAGFRMVDDPHDPDFGLAALPQAPVLAREAHAGLLGAFSARAALFFVGVFAGGLAREIESVRASLARPDGAESARERLDHLIARSPRACAFAAPPRVAITGPVNAGKSTLFNRLVGRRRALVSAEAGTTRDALEARIEIDGHPFRLIDTAGRRSGGDPVERLGIARSRQVRAQADLVLHVEDATRPARLERVERRVDAGNLLVLNKTDLLDARTRLDLAVERARWLPVAAATGAGIDELCGRIVRASSFGGVVPPDLVAPFTPRQTRLLGEARGLLPTDPSRASGVLDRILRGP